MSVHGVFRAARTVMEVGGVVIGEVNARESPVASLRLVDDGDVWLDALIVDQPVQYLGRAIVCTTCSIS